MKMKLLILIIVFLGLSVLLKIKLKNKNKIKVETNNFSCLNCNVVIISIDTLRADHISSLGYSRNTTRNLDKFTNEAMVFTNNISVSSWTLPSQMSLITGLLPHNHKITNKYILNYEKKDEELASLNPKIKTLAEYLKTRDYVTGGFTGGAGVEGEFGFNRGMDEYYDENNFGGFIDSVPKALDWINVNKDKKFFVFLHGYDVHGQYLPPNGFDKRFVDPNYLGNLTGLPDEQKKMREDGILNGKIYLSQTDIKFLTAIYDEKIQRADEILGRFFDEYEKLGLMNKTIFVITSDHGEELYEHGNIDHGQTLYDELIKVPLFIKTPQVKSKIIIDKQVSSIDIMPTILNSVGVTIPVGLDGVDLIETISNSKERDVISETEYRYVVDLESIRTDDGWKLIENNISGLNALYNLKRDKLEERNLINENKNKAKTLLKKMTSFNLKTN